MLELFKAGRFKALELGQADAPRLQAFFDENPDYHLAVYGEPPAADEAQKMFESTLPEGWQYRKEWMIGFVDEHDGHGSLAGMASVVAGLFCDEVWHISLFADSQTRPRPEGRGRAGGHRVFVRSGLVVNYFPYAGCTPSAGRDYPTCSF